MPSQDSEEIDIRALITEIKRLIRLSHETLSLDGEMRELSRQELGAGLSALHTEGQQMLAKVKDQLMQANQVL